MQPPPESSNPDVTNADIEGSIAEVEQALIALKERYAQVESDRQRKVELKNRIEEIKPQLAKNKLPELQAELKEIKTQLEVIEANLESQLFTVDVFKEPFWQAVRFGGLGIVVGWILKSCAS
jgi:chromosome segregation ATPase